MRWELRFMEWGKGWWSSPFLDQVIPWITHLGSHVTVLLFIFLTWAITRKFVLFYKMFLLYGVGSGVIYGLKFALRRKRPPFYRSAAIKISKGPGEIMDPSFPSAHTCLSFMMATLLNYWFPGYGIPFFVFAGFIGWTRVYLDLHYPTDVIAGSILGYGITKIVLHLSPFSM